MWDLPGPGIEPVLTLWTIVRQVLGFSRQEHWGELPCPPPGDLTDPGIETASLTSPELAGGFFTTSTTWEALIPKSPYPNIVSELEVSR